MALPFLRLSELGGGSEEGRDSNSEDMGNCSWEVRCVVLSGGDTGYHEGNTLQTLTGWGHTGMTGWMLWPVLCMCKCT